MAAVFIITMGEIFTYVFSADPGAPVNNYKLWAALAFTALLFAIFFLIPFVRRKTANKALKKTLAHSRGMLLSFAIAFLILIWLRVESVHILSMRLWLMSAAFLFLVWLVYKAAQYTSIKRRIERADARRLKK